MHCQRACSDSVHNGTMICSACAGSIHYKDFILCLMMWKMHDWQPRERQRPNNSCLNTPPTGLSKRNHNCLCSFRSLSPCTSSHLPLACSTYMYMVLQSHFYIDNTRRVSILLSNLWFMSRGLGCGHEFYALQYSSSWIISVYCKYIGSIILNVFLYGRVYHSCGATQNIVNLATRFSDHTFPG